MAGNLYLKIEGITGECKEQGHEGWIDVLSYTEGLSSSGSGGLGGGAGVGTVNYQDMTFTCYLEKAIPALMKGCAGHKAYDKATLHAVKMSGDKSWTYLEIVLSHVVVTSVNLGGMNNELPSVSVSLNFTKIKTEYWEQTKEGGKGTSTSAEWDMKANQ